MATLLAYTSPAAGHLFPLVPGLLELQARGHDVHLLAPSAHVGDLRAAGLRAQPMDERAPVGFKDFDVPKSQRLRSGLAYLMAHAEAERAEVERAVAAVEPDMLIVDINAYGASVAAAASGLPWACSLPSLLPWPGRGIPPYGLGLKPRRDLLGRARDALGWRLVTRAYAKAMLPRLNELRAQAGLPALTDPLQHVAGADRVLVLTGDPLEYPRADVPGRMRFVGAQLWDPPAEAPEWLDEPGDPWVLVTCSTDYQGDERLAAAAIAALRDEPVRVLVTVGDGDAARLSAAANARVERFVAHGPVLERAAAVICHGGMGIVQKSLAAGVPVVAVPFGRDQPEVARRVTEAGAGVAVPLKQLGPERLRAAVRAARALDVGAAAARLRSAGGAERFADAAEELVLEAHGDGSFRTTGTGAGPVIGRTVAS
jgi:MGT family glycosyltransferase